MTEADKKTILIIDDDPDVVQFLRESLEDDGYNVVGAQDGDEGLKLKDQLNPDLVICDLVMPGTGGLQVLTTIRASDKKIPVLILSGQGSQSEFTLCMQAGATDALEKPAEYKLLLYRIESSLGS